MPRQFDRRNQPQSTASHFGMSWLWGFCWLLWGGSQFEDKSCTLLAVEEATFLAIDSRKSRDTAKNGLSRGGVLPPAPLI
jgi:hypothetical protein